jgi:hypothetical protein
MKHVLRQCAALCVVLCLAAPAVPQQGGVGRGGRGGTSEEDVTLPNGKSQRDEILKAEYQQNLKDASDLIDLAQQLKLDLEKNDRYVVSMATLKKTADIEKLVKRIRARMRH